MLLDRPTQVLQQRIANQIYEMCRSQKLQIPGFPDYGHLVTALGNVEPEAGPDNFEVTVRKHDKLVVLQSLAAKWLEHCDFTAEMQKLIQSHNDHYNQDGDYWHADAEPGRRDPQACKLQGFPKMSISKQDPILRQGWR